MGPTPSELDAADGPLVAGEWLQDNLDNPRVRVLDVRGRHPSSSLPHAKRAEYAAGHIPGAVFVDWEHDFVDTDDPVPVQVAGAEDVRDRAGELGIGDGDLVVTYDDYYGIFAARVAWAFRYYGAESTRARRRLDHLDGRRRARSAPTRSSPSAGSSRHARGRGCGARWPRSRKPATRGAALVDARPRHLFLGEQGVANTGHIPGLALPSLPGARRRRDRPVGGAGRGREARARCRHRPRPTAARADRDLRKRRLRDRRAAGARTDRRPLRRRLRRLVQRVERRPHAPVEYGRAR